MKAHQRQIREQLIGADVLAGVWQHGGSDLDIAAATVRTISYAEARELIERHEYLGTMPIAVRCCFGIFFGDRLGGAVVYGDEYGENLGLWDPYGFTGKIIALLRGACAHWAHPHAGSKLIRGSMALLPQQFRVITATVDPRAGEIGVIYQAAGFHYVGTMYPGTRLLVRDGERTLSERTARRRYGTADMSILEGLGLTVERVPRRARYFAFRGTRAEQKTLQAAIADRVQPYPKRSAVVIKFAGRVVTKNIGFVRVRRRQLRNARSGVTFDLLRSVRTDGKPRHEFVMTFGSQRSDRDDTRFWTRAIERMVAHGLSAQQRQRLVDEMIRKGATRSG